MYAKEASYNLVGIFIVSNFSISYIQHNIITEHQAELRISREGIVLAGIPVFMTYILADSNSFLYSSL
jgi:hypothetical protein